MKQSTNHCDTLFRDIFDNANDAIFIRLPEGKFLEVNQVACDLYGYTRDEFLQMSPIDLDVPEHAAKVPERTELIIKNNGAMFETVQRTKEGAIIFAEVKSRPINYNGAPAILSSIRDISKRKNTEIDLLEKKEELERFFSLNLDLLTIANIEGIFLQLNPEWEKTLGYPLSELIGKKFMDFVHPEDIDATTKTVSKLERGEKVLNFINRYRCKDGSYRWIEWRSIAHNNLIYAAARDITKQKLSQIAIRESEEFFKTLFIESPIGLEIYDAKGKLITANSKCLDLFGVNSVASISGFKLFDDPNITDDVKQRLSRGETAHFESLFDFGLVKKNALYETNKSGTIWIDVLISPLHIDDANAGYIVHVRDITASKSLDIALKAANTRLESLLEISSLSNPDIKTISDHILSTLTSITNSNYGFYGFVNDDESIMTIHSWSGEVMNECSMVNKPTDFLISEAGVWGEAIRRREPFIMNDYSSHHAAKKGLPEGHVRLTKLMVVPHFTHGSITSVAAVANRLHDYTIDDIRNVRAFMDSVQAITDAKIAEQRLFESEKTVRALIDSTNDIVALLDKNGAIIEANNPLCKRLEKPFKELFGSVLFDYFDPDTAANRKKYFEDVLREGSPVQFEDERIGTHFESIFYPIKDANGDVIRVTIFARDITERKKAENTIRENEERFRAMFENISSGVAVYQSADDGNDFIFTDFNPASERITGVKKEDVIGRKVTEVFTGVKEIGLFDVFQRTLKSGQPEHHPSTMYDDNQLKFWVENYVYRLPNGEIVAIYDDITARKLAEESLIESELKLRTIFESSKDAICVSKNGIHIFANPAYIELFGYSSFSEIQKVSVLDLIAPSEKETVKEYNRRRSNGETAPATYVSRGIKKDGTEFDMDVTATSYELFNERYTLAILRDITEKKRIEDELLRSEARFRSYFHTQAIGLAITSPEKGWIEVNDNTCGILGYSRDELMKMSWAEITHPEDLASDIEQFNRVIEGEIESYKLEKRFVKKDKSIVWTILGVSCVRKPDGTVDYIIASLQDITERKYIEEELIKYRDTLEKLVEERTKDLKNAHDHLIAAERLAVLGEFAGSIAHEIRNPLAAIGSSTYLLKLYLKDSNTDKESGIISGIENEIKKCADIIDSITRLAKNEPPKTARFDIHELVETILRDKQTPQNISQGLYSPSGPIFIHADKENLRICIKNLITNAVHAMKDGGALSIRLETHNNETLLIHVSDTGVGMNQETMNKIFDPLFSTKSFGMGFGLSIVKMIVEKHGGAISVVSEEGKGTTFTIELPMS